MKHSALYFVQNSVILNFIILWWKIISKMFTVVLSTKRNSATFTKEGYTLKESDNRNDYEETKNLSELENVLDCKSNEINNAEEENNPIIISSIVGQEFVPERDCKFQLYTRLNPDDPQILVLDDVEGLKNSYFDSKLPVRYEYA